MNLINQKQLRHRDLDLTSITLQRCLDQHGDTLADIKLWPDVARLKHLVDQVNSDYGDDPSVLIRQGAELLHEIREALSFAHDECSRASAESPQIITGVQEAKRQYADALDFINKANEHFTAWLNETTVDKQKGNTIMRIVKPQNDGQTTDIGVAKDSRAEIAEALSAMLASTYSLYVKSLFYHWNVTGPQFHSLHELFEEHYQNLHEAGDEIAERVRSLGHFTPGSLQAFASLSSVKDDEHLPKNSDGMLENLQAAHEICASEARNVMKIAEAAEDEVTADMMIERMAFHDQAIWMLSASQA